MDEEKKLLALAAERSQVPQRPLLHLHCRTEADLRIYLSDGGIYRVDEDTADGLDETKVLQHWPDFEASDKAELKQFVDEKVFRKVLLDDLPQGTALVDATWVRKFKRTANKTLKAKSRLCARGFLDPQKEELPTRSTTATRLSQRLVLSVASTHSFSVRSWDVSGAFLKGLTFKRIKIDKWQLCPLQMCGVTLPPLTRTSLWLR